MKIRKVHVVLFIWCVIIFALSSIPSAKISDQSLVDFVLRKTAHITEYMVLYILSYYSFNKNVKYALLFSVFYAASDEFHQRFTPGRGPHIRDVFIDSIGIMLGYLIIWKNYLQKLSPKIVKLLEE